MTPEQTAVAMAPVLFGGMLAEHLVLRATGRPGYSHRRTLNNLSVMVGSRAVLSAFGLAPLLGYGWMREHLGLFAWDASSPWAWVAAFVAVDLAMFCRHWAAHRVAVLWAVHGVHHQSRDYNLSVALRLSWFQDALLIGIPLALLGFPLELVLPCWVIGNLYQFFQHTELVGKLGFVDRILLTPSNHRVHHGCNPRYIDKNYGNILLVWDRLFGTFEPETEPVEYGVLSGLKTYDASENSLEPFRQLWAKARSQRSLWDAARVLFMPPGWEPGRGETVPPLVRDPEPQRANAPSGETRLVATALFTIALAVTMAMTWFADVTSLLGRVVIMLSAILTLAVLGVMLDNRPVEPVPADGLVDRVRAQLAAWLLTLAGPDAGGPLEVLGRVLQPRPKA